MSNALKNIKEGTTAQTERARPDQVENNAGGFVFAVTPKVRLERFLVLGTDGGTYYVGERDLTKQNYKFLQEYAQKNVREMVDTIVAVSDEGRAPKNTQAIFALAVALTFGDDKAYVRQAVNKVVRTGTHVFEFAQYIDNLGGWGRAKRAAVAGWYEDKPADKLAYQAVKYRQRNGWTHRDALRLSHAKPNSDVANFMLGKEFSANAPVILRDFQTAQGITSVDEAVSLIKTSDLPWEAFPTSIHKDAEFWKALFYSGNMPTGAVLRNVTRFARLGMFSDMKFAGDVAERLTDEAAIRKARLHPVQFLVSSNVYDHGQYKSSGRGGWYSYGSRNKDWTSEAVISEALEAGFYTAFKTVEPTGKRTFIALDVSGSMSAEVAGLQGISAAMGSAAMAMVTARAERNYMIRGFTSNGYGGWRNNAELTDLGIGPRQNLNSVMNKTRSQTFGGTDCALPMVWAQQNKVDVDTFIVYTDSETWAGNIQPNQALKKYRQATGIDAKLVVVGMTATEFSIADPKDAGMLDVVGFDTTAPNVIADFARA